MEPSTTVGMIVLGVLFFGALVWGFATLNSSPANNPIKRYEQEEAERELYYKARTLSRRHCATLHEYDLLKEEVLALKDKCSVGSHYAELIESTTLTIKLRRDLAQLRGAPYTYGNLLEEARNLLGLPVDFDRKLLETTIASYRTKYAPQRLNNAPQAARADAQRRLEEAEKAYNLLLKDREGRPKKF